MNGSDRQERLTPADDRRRRWSTEDCVPRAVVVVGTVLVLAGCASPVRPGPVIDPTAPAPFATGDGPVPTQAQARAAVDAAVRRDGLPSVFPRFSSLGSERVPTRITLFACGSAGEYATPQRRLATGVWATCHVDVLDQSDGLVGRTTMRFARQHGAWVLIEDREREFDAR